MEIRTQNFFHAVIKERRQRNVISLVQQDGTCIKDPTMIGQLASQHFGELFSATPFHLNNELFMDIPQSVSDEMNHELCTIPSEQEIWENVKAISPDSAPGEDGFTGDFFQTCWETIKDDIIEMVQGFFQGDYLHQSVTVTMLILLPSEAKVSI